MIKFFRHIRQKLLMDLPSRQAGNKASNYLLYAIGEIVLVVIGILVANRTPLIPKGPPSLQSSF